MIVAASHNVHRSTVDRILATGNQNDGFSTKHRAGRPKKLTVEVEKQLEKTLEQHNFDMSFEELAADVGLHRTTVARHARQRSWRTVRAQLKPRLTATQQASRLAWAEKYKDCTWDAWVDVDEKNFHTIAANRLLKVPPNATAPTVEVQHKSHIPKVMVLSAIAKPNIKHKFNGKVGVWRVCEVVEAKRSSKHHQKGDLYKKDTTMDADKFFEMMIECVFPAIRDRMPWARSVVVQVDNASPHTGKHTIEKLNNTPTPENSRTQITVVCQPSQSPDTNANDLGFFHSLQKRVEKLRGHGSAFDVAGLVERIETAWEKYPSQQLKNIFQTKSQVLKQIKEHHGGNNFKLTHQK